VPLIIVVALGMIILGKLGFPNDTWPAFMVMIFFFEAHMDIKKAPTFWWEVCSASQI